MITDLIYRCPVCGRFDWFSNGQCTGCGAGAKLLSRSTLAINGKAAHVSYWYARVLAFELPQAVNGTVLRSRRIRLFKETSQEIYKGPSGIIATRFGRRPMDEGTLSLKKKQLVFSGDKIMENILFKSIRAVTIESNTVIIVCPGQGVFFFDFLKESGKKWEDCIQKAIRKYHATERIIEFCPRIKFASDSRPLPIRPAMIRPVRIPEHRWYKKEPKILIAILRVVLKRIITAVFRIRVTGLDHIPAKGPAILVANHASFLDSIILSVYPQRHIWFMAKNSQYAHPLMRRFLKLARSFPVRRYTTDVQAVRNALRILQNEHIMGVFPEGERNWDEKMMRFKQGTMRLILAAGHPVIPVGINGAYELMPRWAAGIKRVPVTINFGTPICFDPVPIPAHTPAQIRFVTETLRQRIQTLMEQEN